MLDIYAVIMSAAKRNRYLWPTRNSLQDAGFWPLNIVFDGSVPKRNDIFTSSSGARIGIVPTFRRAFHELSGFGDGFHVVFQDDVTAEPGLREWLEANLPADRGIFSLYLSEGRTATEGWSELPDDGEYPTNVGACGIMMDHETARRFLSAPPFPRIDRLGSQLALWARQEKIPFWLHSPGLLEHVGEVRVRDIE